MAHGGGWYLLAVKDNFRDPTFTQHLRRDFAYLAAPPVCSAAHDWSKTRWSGGDCLSASLRTYTLMGNTNGYPGRERSQSSLG